MPFKQSRPSGVGFLFCGGKGLQSGVCSRGLAVCRERGRELRSGGKKTEAYDFATHRFVILRINTIFA